MPTNRVARNKCGTAYSGWLDGAHPLVEDGEVPMTVCFTLNPTTCKNTKEISVRNCGSYYVYKLYKPPGCNMRYCGTN